MTQIFKNSYRISGLIIFLIALVCTIKSYGQREPLYTQYMYNIGAFNPAYVGTVEKLDISGLYRAQWIDIPGAPRNIRLGLNIPFESRKHGMGLNVISDEIGPTTNTFVDVSYSYQINVSEFTKLSFGIAAGGSFLNVDFSKGSFENPGEPILDRANINEFYPTIGAGLFLYQDNWYLGASVPNFLTDGLYDESVATIVEDNLQFTFIGGYVFDVSDNLKFKPAFLFNSIQGAPVTVNISTNFLIKDVFTLGAAYSIDNSISGLAGFQISSGTFIGYSYDYNTTGLGEFNSGSHEVILKFYVGQGSGKSKSDRSKPQKGKPKQIDTPRFF